jgi:MarR family 2-MHQ and catechol resistance regulon transcriptional repressor
MTYAITQLESKELARRSLSEQDKRIIYVELTEAGETLLQKIFPEYEAFLRHLFASLAEADALRFIEQLRHLERAVSDAAEDAPDGGSLPPIN